MLTQTPEIYKLTSEVILVHSSCKLLRRNAKEAPHNKVRHIATIVKQKAKSALQDGDRERKVNARMKWVPP